MEAVLKENIYKRMKEIKALQEKSHTERIPESLVMKLTHRCNLNCRYCYMGEQYQADMPNETAYNILRQIDNAMDRDITIYLHGGEPFLRLETIQFIGEKIKEGHFKNRFHLMIQTNGTIYNDEVLETCKKYNLHVGISLDGVSEAYIQLRCYADGRNVLNDVFATMKQFHENRIPLGLISVLTDANVKGFIDTYREISNYGVYEVTATLPVSNGRADKALLSA